ncbi:MAG: sugar-binding domain-containing protein [Peptoniphilus sp.]|nr:sugar-binding domain-containing protein [Peptoniphilus sp.]
MNVELLSSFVPEFRNIFIRRYEILEYLNREGAVGRRTLSKKLKISERIIRDEIERLKEMNYVYVNSAGVNIKKEGKVNLKRFSEVYRELNNLTELGNRIASFLEIEEVVVVKGDSSKDDYAFTNLGAATAGLINVSMCDGDYIGVTGGKTLSAIADVLSENKRELDLTIIPARGTLGKNVEYQANSVASKIAERLNCDYRILPVPDAAPDKALNILLENEDIHRTYEMLKELDLLIFSIGRADEMLERKGADPQEKKEILERGAVSEVIGHYFDIKGEEVYTSQSVGISLEDFLNIPRVFGIAGGAEKAEAIISISKLRSDMVLVIDESAANCIINSRR